MDIWSNLTKLQNDYLGLPNEYNSFQFKVYTNIKEKKPAIQEKLLTKRCKVAACLEDKIAIILKVAINRLLKPIIDAFQQNSSRGSIVIINAIDIGCDAIIYHNF